jgi:hypothetical protein
MTTFNNYSNGEGNVLSAHTMKAYTGRKCIALLILNPGTRRKCVVNLMPRLLYPQQRTLVSKEEAAGSQSCSGHFGEEKNLLPLLGFEP